MKVEVYQDKIGEWRWRIVARNGRILADSGEGYRRRDKARAALRKIVLGMCNAAVEPQKREG